MVNCAYCMFHTSEIIEEIYLFLYEFQVKAVFFYLSAGIGRSGTFVMVDSILTEVSHSLMHLHLLAAQLSLEINTYWNIAT